MLLLKRIWRPLLALLLLFILVQKGPFKLDQLQATLSQPSILLLGAGAVLFQVLIFAIRWKLFVDLVTKSRYLQLIRLTLVGMFFNFFIPGGVGGDIVKALELSKDNQASRSETLSTVMSDRIFGLFAMLTFSTIFLLFEYWHIRSAFLGRFAFISLLFWSGMTFVLLFFPLIFKKMQIYLSTKDSNVLVKIEKLISSLQLTFINFRAVGLQSKSLALSLATQLVAIYFMYCVVIKLGTPPPSFLIFFALCCFGFVASALPIMPGGIGVGQYAFYALFAPISPELGQSTITAITTLQIFLLLYAIVGGIIFSLNPKNKKEILEYTDTTI